MTSPYAGFLSWLDRIAESPFPGLGGKINIRDTIAICVIALPIVLAVMFLLTTPPQYVASMTISPNLKDPRTNQTSGAGVGSIAASLLGGSDNTLPELYSELLDKLYSPEVGQALLNYPDLIDRLYPGQYDARTKTLTAKPGLMFRIKRILTLGRLKFAPPGPAEIGNRLHDIIFVVPVGTTPMRQLRLFDPNPRMAERMLMVVFSLADASIKHDEAIRASELYGYISRQLDKENSISSQQMLRALADQYRFQMVLSALNQPMAAQIVDPPRAGTMPDTPHFGLTMAIGVGASLFLGLLYLYYLYYWRARPRTPLK